MQQAISTHAIHLASHDSYTAGSTETLVLNKFITWWLRNQPEWTKTQKMNVCINRKWVTLKEPVPVFISYFTAWVDSEGLLNFREDIYGHDKKLAKHLFE